MIMLFSGTPGSGKSLHAADMIIHKLMGGRTVVTNFEINPKYTQKYGDRIICADNQTITPEFLKNVSRETFSGSRPKEGTIYLFYDESQLTFNAREWGQKDRAEWIEFFTQHRKYGYNIVLIAQFDRMLDRQVRSLIEYEYVHRKVSNYGWRGLLLQLFMFAPSLFVAVEIWYPMKERLGSEFFRYRKRRADLYDTFKDFKKVESGG